MAIKDKGYGDSGSIGFDSVSERDDDGKAVGFMDADQMKAGEHYLEVVSLDVFERNEKDFIKAWLFDPRNGLLTEMFGELKTNTMWKLDRAVLGIFGRTIPVEEIQGDSGRMPMVTRKRALGLYVKVEIKDSDYEGQDVLIVGSGSFQPPEGFKPMFDHSTHEPTGAWPTSAGELLAKRGGGGSKASNDDGADW